MFFEGRTQLGHDVLKLGYSMSALGASCFCLSRRGEAEFAQIVYVRSYLHQGVPARL